MFFWCVCVLMYVCVSVGVFYLNVISMRISDFLYMCVRVSCLFVCLFVLFYLPIYSCPSRNLSKKIDLNSPQYFLSPDVKYDI